MFNTQDPVMPAGLLESLSKAVGAYATGREISKYLAECSLPDALGEGATKWLRLHNAFAAFQNKHQVSNNILKFTQKVIHPTRFINENDRFEEARLEVNKCLAFIGRELGQSGKLRKVEIASTIDEAQKRANILQQKLQNRQVHAEVLRFCKAELLQNNYFHAVFEATKSVAERVRGLTGLATDGGALIDNAFALGPDNCPIIRVNALATESQESEHKGFMNLLKGIFGIFRNTTGHAPRIVWQMDEEDALDCLTMVSYAHRKLDGAKLRREH